MLALSIAPGVGRAIREPELRLDKEHLGAVRRCLERVALYVARLAAALRRGTAAGLPQDSHARVA